MSDTITITGNIATEPESRGNASAPITRFRLASTQRRLDRESGRWVDGHTNWYTVSAFRLLAVHAQQSLHKGQRVIVTGRLKVSTWENASGKGTSIDIDAEAIGHDLLWGTSEFRRDDHEAGPTGGQSTSTAWSVDSPEAPVSQTWPTPMTPPGESPASESGSAAAKDREPAYAGEEVPF